MNRKYPHFKNCRCGSGDQEEGLQPDHPWHVKSPNHHNCFWVYIRHNNRPHTLSEIANLLSLSITRITSIERRATEKLKHRLKKVIND